MSANLLPLDECAQRLTGLYTARAALNLLIWRANQSIADRQRALVPEGGWPGKNQEARDAARDAAGAADETLAGHVAQRDEAHGQLFELEAEISGVEAQRRAGEWRIRERMVDALTGRGLAPQGRGDQAEGAIDGDVTQAQADAELEAAFGAHLEEQAEVAAADDGPAPDERADIPF